MIHKSQDLSDKSICVSCVYVFLLTMGNSIAALQKKLVNKGAFLLKVTTVCSTNCADILYYVGIKIRASIDERRIYIGEARVCII